MREGGVGPHFESYKRREAARYRGRPRAQSAQAWADPAASDAPLPPPFPEQPAALPQSQNLLRALRTEPYDVFKERQTLELERQKLIVERKQLMAEREAAATEMAALAEKKRELDHVRQAIERAAPAASAERIQARVRAIRARVEYARLSAEKVLAKEEEASQRAARSSAFAAGRQQRQHARRLEVAALALQCAARLMLARRRVGARRAVRVDVRQQQQQTDASVRQAVAASLANVSNGRAATRVQAALRGFLARRATQLPALLKLRARKARRAALDDQIARGQAACTVQRVIRGRLDRSRAAQARQDAARDATRRKQRQQKRTAQAKVDMERHLQRSGNARRVQNAWRSLKARRELKKRRSKRTDAQQAKAYKEEALRLPATDTPDGTPQALVEAALAKQAAASLEAAASAVGMAGAAAVTARGGQFRRLRHRGNPGELQISAAVVPPCRARRRVSCRRPPRRSRGAGRSPGARPP